MSEINGQDYVTGTTKWYNADKGFGFIALPGGGVDIFVHAKQLKASGIERALVEGEKVKFLTSKGPKGAFATNIEIIP